MWQLCVVFVELVSSSAGGSDGVGYSTTAVVGGVVGVLAVFSVFTLAVVFGLLGECVEVYCECV